MTMAHITAIINQKGGVGKSTTAHALGAGLARMGQTVLYIDLDAQQNLTYTLGADPRKPGAFEVLTRKATAQEATQQTPQGPVIAASGQLATDGLLTDTGKEYRLKEALEPLEGAYNRIIVDCPPSLGILTIAALTASTDAIIPAQADTYSLQALGQFSQTLEAVRRYTNPRLQLAGVLLTRYNGRAVLSRDLAEMLEATAAQLGTRLFNTRIRECVAIKEAQTARQDIYTYAPRSNAAADYTAFIREVTDNGKETV